MCVLNLITQLTATNIDTALAANPKIYYVRCMDDWLALTKTRNHLRQAIKRTLQILAALKLTMHPDKTFIGWSKAGFDFLGYHLSLEQIELSKTTINRCKTKVVQLYERGASQARLEQYWRNFVRRAKGGLQRYKVAQYNLYLHGYPIKTAVSNLFFVIVRSVSDAINQKSI